MTTRGWMFSLSRSVAAVNRVCVAGAARGVRALTDGVEAAPAVQHRRHLGTDLTTLQASADAVGELDRTVSVDSSIHRVHHHGATAAREDDHPGGRRRRGSGGGRPIRYDRTAYRRRNVVERAFTQLESWRGIAIRYDEHATVFHGAVALASILI